MIPAGQVAAGLPQRLFNLPSSPDLAAQKRKPLVRPDCRRSCFVTMHLKQNIFKPSL
jgi:hypothetical protein